MQESLNLVLLSVISKCLYPGKIRRRRLSIYIGGRGWLRDGAVEGSQEVALVLVQGNLLKERVLGHELTHGFLGGLLRSAQLLVETAGQVQRR